MTNLYEFLRRVKTDAVGPYGDFTITEDEWNWLEQYLQAPDHQIHFKARKVGEENGEPVYAQDYAIAGDTVDIFSLLTEAMMANSNFAGLVGAACKFFDEHVEKCPDCDARLDYANPEKPDWTFVKHKTTP